MHSPKNKFNFHTQTKKEQTKEEQVENLLGFCSQNRKYYTQVAVN